MHVKRRTEVTWRLEYHASVTGQRRAACPGGEGDLTSCIRANAQRAIKSTSAVRGRKDDAALVQSRQPF